MSIVIADEVTDTGSLTIRRVSVSEMDNNSYLLTCAQTGAQLLIDAADEAERLLALLHEGSPDGRLDTVVTTHKHWDHVRALAAIVEATGARTAAGEDDADALPVAVDVRLQHGDTVEVGDVTLDVVHLRGHTPGSVALTHHGADGSVQVFTGDSLFPGGVGNTQGHAGRFRSLIDDVEQRLFAVLPDETVVHPGHGAGTTLGTERPHITGWRERGW